MKRTKLVFMLHPLRVGNKSCAKSVVFLGDSLMMTSVNLQAGRRLETASFDSPEWPVPRTCCAAGRFREGLLAVPESEWPVRACVRASHETEIKRTDNGRLGIRRNRGAPKYKDGNAACIESYFAAFLRRGFAAPSTASPIRSEALFFELSSRSSNSSRMARMFPKIYLRSC